MTNKASDASLTIVPVVAPVYTAAHFYSGIPIIKNVVIKNIPSSLCGCLSLAMEARSANAEVFSIKVNIADFSLSQYTSENSDTVILNLEKHKILPNSAFMHELSANAGIRIQTVITVGDVTASCVQTVKISPFGHICPEMPPELLCTYVLPDCEFASKVEKRLSAQVKKITERLKRQAPRPLVYAEAIANVMLSAKLTYSAMHREMLDGDCIIRDPDTLVDSNKRTVSLTEAALFYCSCAERCGLHPGIIFLRKGAGSVKVLVSIGLSDYFPGSPVSESISELRERILDREIFVFDVLGLLGTEDMDFERNVTETTNLVLKSSSTLIFSVDVYTSRLCGVASLRPFDRGVAKDIYGGYKSIEETVKRICGNADSASVFGFSPYSFTSLGLCVKPNELVFSQEYTICPLDDEIISAESDAILSFSSFRPRNLAENPRNMNQQAVFEAKLGELRERTENAVGKGTVYGYPAKYILSGEKLYAERIREELYSDAVKLCEAVRASRLLCGNTEIYVAAGIIAIANEGRVSYAPCAYIPCEIIFENRTAVLKFGTDKTVINTSLISHIEKTTGASYNTRVQTFFEENPTLDSSDKATELSACLYAFEGICEDYPDSLRFINDTLLSVFDLSYTLMRDCLEDSGSGKFEQFVESGKYSCCENPASPYGRLEATLPFDVPSEVRNAVKAAENDSIIISGVHGTGKKKALGNIIARAALCSEDVLVCSKYSESLDSLYDTMAKGGIGELCLDAQRIDSVRTQILADLENVLSDAEYPAGAPEKDACALEHTLSAYADDLYSEFGFGYSLYDCIDSYCKCELCCTDEPIELILDVRDLSRAGADELFSVADSLCEKAAEIYALSKKGAYDIGDSLKYIKNTNKIPEDICELFGKASDELGILAQKSAFARGCLGMSEAGIPDVRTLISLGEFLELIMKSGIDFLPEGLLCTSTYRSSKSIEKACGIIDEIGTLNASLSGVSERIASISCTALYIKWKDAENNPFVKNSISHEIRKYLPEKTKLSSKETEELLEKLSKREELRRELALVLSEVSSSLGTIWQNEETDTERARRIAEFALSADICIKKLFRSSNENLSELHSGITRLITALSEDKSTNADFVAAVAAFRRLSNEKGGLLNELSEALCIDLYELRFPEGILGKDGLSQMLRAFRENLQPFATLHELNALKKEAARIGLADVVSYIEGNPVGESTKTLIHKSIYLAFAKYIIFSKIHLVGNELSETCKKYTEVYFYEKKLARFNLISARRKKFRDYISGDEGKRELYALRKSLSDKSVSLTELLENHAGILRVMYSAVFVPLSTAYRLRNHRSVLVLTDCEKTDACEALPLCTGYDKCIFVSSPFERAGSIMASLPLGIPTFRLTRVLPEKNGYIADFARSLYPDCVSFICKDRTERTLNYVKCVGGLYDKNSKANKIEAVQVCETALIAAREHGFENVGIIAMTYGQASEIMSGLSILANKYSDGRIADIPVRYIGSIGDFSKDCIVLSVAFGKNVFSFTRSFGITDDISLSHGSAPFCMSELLCCARVLYVVASAEPEDIMTDNLCLGASAVSALLYFAKLGAVQRPALHNKTCDTQSGIDGRIRRELCDGFCHNPFFGGVGIATHNGRAIIYENGYIRDAYDRVVLPILEAQTRGYEPCFSDICGLINNNYSADSENPSRK
ncbi:MAG: hypothetical protein IKU43_06195 [Clostridia bacterium]|nr:hypothetical protein [Clostridia bacterium]